MNHLVYLLTVYGEGSQFYERAIYEQTVTFFDKVFHPSLSAFVIICIIIEGTFLYRITYSIYKYIKKYRGPKIEPWGIPLYMSSHLLSTNNRRLEKGPG
jgi:hypothetical protein